MRAKSAVGANDTFARRITEVRDTSGLSIRASNKGMQVTLHTR